MRAEELIGLMKGEQPYTKESLSDLGAVLEEYPYFQTAQLLYTLNLQANKDSLFHSELRKTACYVNDRKKLFFLVEKQAFPPDFIEKQEKETPVEISDFDRLDFFLSDQKESTPPQSHQEDQTLVVSTDYVSYWLSEEKQESSANAVPLKQQGMIDKFLEENKKSPIKITRTSSTGEISDEMPFQDLDTVSQESFISETLAKIYLKQKKYEKALEIIRKLNLIYPEKNIYFADQIRFLEKLINNKKTK